MVYVTQDPIEAMTLADRIVVMNQGRIEQVGKPLDLYYAPANLFVAGFLGSPAMSFFKATVDRFAEGLAHISGQRSSPASRRPATARLGKARADCRRQPEHLASPASVAFATKGAVELVERLGVSSFAHVRRADDQMLVAEICSRQAPRPGESVTLGADLSEAHAFDEAGRRVDLAAP